LKTPQLCVEDDLESDGLNFKSASDLLAAGESFPTQYVYEKELERLSDMIPRLHEECIRRKSEFEYYKAFEKEWLKMETNLVRGEYDKLSSKMKLEKITYNETNQLVYDSRLKRSFDSLVPLSC